MKRDVRAFIVGAILLPLSALPFVFYAIKTPEGRLLADRAKAILDAPSLPAYDDEERDALRAAAPRYDDGVMVLVYHGIGSGTSGEGKYNISPDRFADHLGALRAAGMKPVTMQEVAVALTTNTRLPEDAVAVTFDDGRTDAMLYADPLLEDAGWRASMYVITGRTDGTSPYYVNWDKLEDYHDSGRWDLQAHTDDLHREEATPSGPLPALTALRRGETLDQFRHRIRTDLTRSSDEIARHTGTRPRTFAYPFGAYGAERTSAPELQGIVADEVDRLYDLAVDQDGQDSLGLATVCDEALNIHRLDVKDWSGLALLERLGEAAGRTVPCGEGAARSPTSGTWQRGTNTSLR